MLRLRVFVSSPGDVGAERGVALAVAERLQFEFRGQIQLETYLWERSLLRATVESNQSGTTAQRARALLWLEEAFKNPLRQEDFRTEFWTMAETLFALRQVQGRLGRRADEPTAALKQ